MIKLSVKVLELAREGLKKRGFGEEVFLENIFDRAEKLLSPARKIVNGLEKGKTIEDFVYEFAKTA